MMLLSRNSCGSEIRASGVAFEARCDLASTCPSSFISPFSPSLGTATLLGLRSHCPLIFCPENSVFLMSHLLLKASEESPRQIEFLWALTLGKGVWVCEAHSYSGCIIVTQRHVGCKLFVLVFESFDPSVPWKEPSLLSFWNRSAQPDFSLLSYRLKLWWRICRTQRQGSKCRIRRSWSPASLMPWQVTYLVIYVPYAGAGKLQLMGQTGPQAVLVNKVLSEHVYLPIYVLSLAAFVLQWQS